jgi:ferredoxin--NADP+ reductase
MILRVRPDEGLPAFAAGQYATLGLGNWEPRIENVHREQILEPRAPRQLIRRAYSISCPLLDEQGQLVTCRDLDFLEFYIARVSHPNDDPPRLTPRLFALAERSWLFVGPRFHGTYTLAPCADDNAMVFLATGTGEAPHNAMIAELLARGHRGPIVSAVCVRYRNDLGYLEVHRKLEMRFDNYHFVTLTTREPQNVDPSRPDYIGKQYLQEFVRSGRFETVTGIFLDPTRTHVYLCGNPSMIGLRTPTRAAQSHPEPAGMVDILAMRGFRLDHPHAPGNLHVEKFW